MFSFNINIKCSLKIDFPSMILYVGTYKLYVLNINRIPQWILQYIVVILVISDGSRSFWYAACFDSSHLVNQKIIFLKYLSTRMNLIPKNVLNYKNSNKFDFKIILNT